MLLLLLGCVGDKAGDGAETALPDDSGTDSGEDAQTGGSSWTAVCAPVEDEPCATSADTSPWVRLTGDAASGVVPRLVGMGGWVVVGDVDGDGADDVAWAASDSLSVYRGPDFLVGRTDAPMAVCAVAVALSGIRVGDLDGDGLADVVTSRSLDPEG